MPEQTPQRADGSLGHAGHGVVVLHGQTTEREAREVAHHEVAGARGGHDHRITVLGLDLAADLLDGARVLCDLRAQVGAVDDTVLRVGVRGIHRIAHEGEGRAGLHGALEDQAHEVFQQHGALGDARIGHAVAVAALPFLAVVVLQRIALHREDVVRAHEVPVPIQTLLGHLPEKIGVAHCREHVVGLHAIVAVVGAQVEELRQVAMPSVQVHGHGALAHAQLVHGHRGVVNHANPANHAAGHTLEAADGTARSANLAQVHAHATAILAHLGEVVDAAVDAHERVRHGVDEAAGELVVGLARVAHGRRGHGDFQLGKRVVEALDPAQTVAALRIRTLAHGKMQRDAEEHLLRALERLVRMTLDDVALREQVEAGIGEQLIARGVHEGRSLLNFLGRVRSQNVVAVQSLVREIADKLVEGRDTQGCAGGGEPCRECEVQQAAGDHLPARGFLAGRLHGCTDERIHAGGAVLPLAGEAAVAGGESGQGVLGLGKITLDATEHGFQRLDGRGVLIARSERCVRPADRGKGGGAWPQDDGAGQGTAAGTQLRASMAVEDIRLGNVEESLLHQDALHLVLDGLDGSGLVGSQGALNSGEQTSQRALVRLDANLNKRFMHGGGDFAAVITLGAPVALPDVTRDYHGSRPLKRSQTGRKPVQSLKPFQICCELYSI